MKYGEPWRHWPHRRRMAVDVSNSITFEAPDEARARRIVACVNACAGLDLPDDVPAGALAELVAACRPFAELAPAFAAIGGNVQRRNDTEVYRAHWDPANPDGKAVTNGDFRAVAAALAKLERGGA